jgi:hypothetical protein
MEDQDLIRNSLCRLPDYYAGFKKRRANINESENEKQIPEH